MQDVHKFKLEPELCSHLTEIVGQVGNCVKPLSLFSLNTNNAVRFLSAPLVLEKIMVALGNSRLGGQFGHLLICVTFPHGSSVDLVFMQ